MKTSKTLKYNLSGIMKYAHTMWTPIPMSFSERLKEAWAKAKIYMASGKATGQFVIVVDNSQVKTWEDGLVEYYANAKPAQYFGD